MKMYTRLRLGGGPDSGTVVFVSWNDNDGGGKKQFFTRWAEIDGDGGHIKGRVEVWR